MRQFMDRDRTMTEFNEELQDDPFESNTEGDAPDKSGPPVGGLSNNSVMSRLLDGGAMGPPVEDIKRDYGLPREWSIALRGVLRAAPGDGMPPLGEIVGGVALGVMKQQSGTSDGDSQTIDEPDQPKGQNVAPGTEPPQP